MMTNRSYTIFSEDDPPEGELWTNYCAYTYKKRWSDYFVAMERDMPRLRCFSLGGENVQLDSPEYEEEANKACAYANSTPDETGNVSDVFLYLERRLSSRLDNQDADALRGLLRHIGQRVAGVRLPNSEL
ncbi:hypothetical protein BJX66DRAFT_307343 [Aspergillus keveii]|uniref:Uncharacterized protein n=1 Tax=Aspergillus keveii TaxID=714993 RepID=A0ABR4G0V7_9EURO